MRHKQGAYVSKALDLFDRAMAAVAAAAPKAALDPARPVYQLLPPAQWMNDVCGAFQLDGYTHVFFQFHPWSDRFGGSDVLEGIGWGHARSRDLVHWEFLPPALLPSEATGDILDGSGCAWVRPDGTPMLFFTHTPIGYPQEKRQQWAAVPADEDLIAWRRVDIGLAPGKSGVADNIKHNWADMFVFEAGGRFLAVFKESEGMVCEAQNRQLTAWKAVGRIDGADGECPNLFPLGGSYVLLRSTYPISYLVGDFDPQAVDFRVACESRVLDYGYGGDEMPAYTARGLYGTTVYKDAGGRTILLGWVSGFEPGRGWNGCMSLPRILHLNGNRELIQTPAPELRVLRGKHITLRDVTLNSETMVVDGAQGDSLEIRAEFQAGTARAFGLRLRRSDDEIIIKRTADRLDVAGTEVPLNPLDDGTFKLHLFLDKSVLEAFIDGGRQAVTRVIAAGEEDLGVDIFAAGGDAKVVSLDVWQMAPIW